MILNDYVWLCTAINDYGWLCMTMYDYAWLWLYMTMYDHIWLFNIMNAYVWLYKPVSQALFDFKCRQYWKFKKSWRQWTLWESSTNRNYSFLSGVFLNSKYEYFHFFKVMLELKKGIWLYDYFAWP